MKTLIYILVVFLSLGFAAIAPAAQGDFVQACEVVNFSGPGSETPIGIGKGTRSDNLSVRCTPIAGESPQVNCNNADKDFVQLCETCQAQSLDNIWSFFSNGCVKPLGQ